jgi:hypothetical protein
MVTVSRQNKAWHGMAWHGTYGGGDGETKEERKMEKEFGDLCRQFLPRLSHRK